MYILKANEIVLNTYLHKTICYVKFSTISPARVRDVRGAETLMLSALYVQCETNVHVRTIVIYI